MCSVYLWVPVSRRLCPLRVPEVLERRTHPYLTPRSRTSTWSPVFPPPSEGRGRGFTQTLRSSKWLVRGKGEVCGWWVLLQGCSDCESVWIGRRKRDVVLPTFPFSFGPCLMSTHHRRVWVTDRDFSPTVGRLEGTLAGGGRNVRIQFFVCKVCRSTRLRYVLRPSLAKSFKPFRKVYTRRSFTSDPPFPARETHRDWAGQGEWTLFP